MQKCGIVKYDKLAKEQVTISIRKYAEKLNISDKSVRNAIADGKITKGVKYVAQLVKGKIVQVPQIIEVIADKEYGNSKKQIKQQPGVSKSKVAEKLEKQIKPIEKKTDTKKKTSLREKPATEPPAVDIENLSYEELLNNIKIDESLNYSEILRRNELVVLILNKMKAEKERGVLVEKSVIDKTLYEMGNRIKTNFLNIPSRVASLLRSSTNDIDAINILTSEITQVLEGLSTI